MRKAVTFEDALEALKENGFPVVVDQSALDDAVEMDSKMEVFDHGFSVDQWLRYAMLKLNATFIITRQGTLRFISLDEASDAKYFQTVVYNVSPLAEDWRTVFILANQIQVSVARDEWEDAGGSATMQPRVQDGQQLLIITCNDRTHHQVRWLLDELVIATGAISDGSTKVCGQATARPLSHGLGTLPNAMASLEKLRTPAVVVSRVIEVPSQSQTPVQRQLAKYPVRPDSNQRRSPTGGIF